MTKMTKMIIGVVVVVVVVGGVVGYFLFKGQYSPFTAVGTKGSMNWEELSETFTTTSKTSLLKIIVMGEGIPAKQGIAFDNITLNGALIPNGNFEESNDNDSNSHYAKDWQQDNAGIYNGMRRYCSGVKPQEGMCVMGYVSDGNNRIATTSRFISVKPNTSYTIKGYAWNTSTSGQAVIEYVQFDGAHKELRKDEIFPPRSSGPWNTGKPF